jgi:glycosyltransferase involved in cell wall biosynthesis
MPQSSNRICLAHIISDLSVGGAEMMLYKLLAETDLNRFAPVVISLIDRGDLRARIEALGIPVHTVKMKPGLPSPLGFWRLVRLLRRLRPDFMLGWMYHSCLAAQLARFSMAHETKVFWSIHYANESLASEKLLTAAVIRICALFSRLADQIIFVSYASQSQHQRFGYHLGRSCVIPNGINTSEFAPSKESRASVRRELGLSEAAILIGTTGRYHPTKDHANFLKAAALLTKKYPDANFVMIGQGVDDQNVELRRLIEAFGLTRRVRLWGERHDIPRIAAALDIFSLSSYSESFPNVIGEAMACEVTCAVTHVGDSSLIVGDTGIVVSPRDSRALAAAWSNIIELSAEERIAMGRSARSRVIERFKLESVVAQYETLYSILPGLKAPEVNSHPQLPIARLKARFDDSGVG